MHPIVPHIFYAGLSRSAFVKPPMLFSDVVDISQSSFAIAGKFFEIVLLKRKEVSFVIFLGLPEVVYVSEDKVGIANIAAEVLKS
jgi:hypothetical protein